MKNRHPAISVVMPVHNDERYLGWAIESILEQSFRDFELIVVDDASDDTSAAIIDSCIKKDQRVKKIKNEKKQGITKSLNIGLEKARGKYIARMDSDDVSLPERFSYQYEILESDPNLFLVGSSLSEIIDENGVVIGNRGRPISHDELEKAICEKNIFLPHPSFMFRRADGFLYREKLDYAQDRDFLLRAITEGKKIMFTSEVVLQYRIHEKSASSNKREKQKQISDQVVAWHQERKKTGRDGYENFSPETLTFTNEKITPAGRSRIRKFDAKYEMTREKKYLRQSIKVKIDAHSYPKKLVYFRHYATSFLPRTVVRFLKKFRN